MRVSFGRWKNKALLMGAAVALLIVCTMGVVGAAALPEAPDFDLVELRSDGSVDVVSLSDWNGRPVVLYFWTTYCPYCAVDLPALLEAFPALRTQREDGLVFFAVDIGESAQHVRSHMEQRGYEMPVLLDTEMEVSFMYRAVGTPTYVFITGDGEKYHQHVGPMDHDLFASYVAALEPSVDGTAPVQ